MKITSQIEDQRECSIQIVKVKYVNGRGLSAKDNFS